VNEQALVEHRRIAIARTLKREGFDIERVRFARGGHVLVDGERVHSPAAHAVRRTLRAFLSREWRHARRSFAGHGPVGALAPFGAQRRGGCKAPPAAATPHHHDHLTA
jgi:hypothetical protein